jgi:mitotic spindle assembly checkpoint protein MAD2
MSSTECSGKVVLKGSSKIVADYFEFAVNSILFQRGIYPAEDFVTVRKYDLPMLISNDDDVRKYINSIMVQIRKWIYGKKIAKLVVVIVAKSSGDSVERWEFDISILNTEEDGSAPGEKPILVIQKEIQTIIRQITSSVTYLPILDDEEYTFNVLVHTDGNNNPQNIPLEWCDTNGDTKTLSGNVESVSFTSFSTTVHQVGTSVKYRLPQ